MSDITDPEALGEKRAAMLKNWDDEPSSGDAWKLMFYECESCGHRERIWNARPHVTPFGGVKCIRCGSTEALGSMTHKYFGSDEYLPDHLPRKGDLIFIDCPPEIALLYARRLIHGGDKVSGLPAPPSAEDIALHNLASFGGHSPFCLRLQS